MGAGYGFCEALRLELNRREVKLAKGPGAAPLKVLHRADFHVTHFGGLEIAAEAIELGLREKPDLACLTGDFVSNRFFDFQALAKVLTRLGGSVPTYACLGNHDGGNWAARNRGFEGLDEISQLLKESGIQLLLNNSKDLRYQGWNVRLTGLADIWSGCFDVGAAFSTPPSAQNHASIVLAHNPDLKDCLYAYPWDLMLCGHTHGGQINLPFVGPLYLPVQDRRFVAGLYRWKDRWLHITKGVGSTMHLRFNCRPEVSLLTLI